MSCECGCCSGVHAATPVMVRNRPGLAEISHRPGDWAAYLDSLRAKLSSARFPELAALTSRASDDASIALCDAWAVAAEVLSFYQDRIANEGYLRTATERRSILELGRLTGYTLRPGVSASVYLSYEIDANAGSTTIPAGTRAQSVPGTGEKMQTFETAEPLAARADWSRITVRLSQPQWRSWINERHSVYGVLERGLILAGTATNLKPNDVLVVDYGQGSITPYRVDSVTPDDVARTTLVRVRAWAVDGKTGTHSLMSQQTDEPDWRTVSAMVGEIGRPLHRQPRDAAHVPNRFGTARDAGREVYSKLLATRSVALRDMLVPALKSFDAARSDLRPIRVYALRTKTGLFGNAAPAFLATQLSDGGSPTFGQLSLGVAWHDLPQIRGASSDPILLKELPLDAVHDAIKPGDAAWVVIDGPVLSGDTTARPFVWKLDGNETATMSIGAAISAKTSRLSTAIKWIELTKASLTDSGLGGLHILRETQVYAGAEELALARDPVTESIDDVDEIELDGYYDSLVPGMWLIAAGDRDDIADPKVVVPVAERAMVAVVRHDVVRIMKHALPPQPPLPGDDTPSSERLPGDTLHTFVRLAEPLAYRYRRASFALHGNVVRATHGETRRETLGGGDATQPFQRFTLKTPPLTYISAPTTSGVASTLAVRVNRLLWHETADLPTAPADARLYATSRDDAEVTSVRFGDGVHGARLPTGVDNVTSVYRTGIGRAGNVRAGQITLPTDKPLGVKGVTNPIRASGGAEPDTLLQARENAPLAVTALDRLVSVKDYEDFARGYAGIGKAVATTLRGGARQVVHVTIAGIDDVPIDETSDLYVNLVESLRRYGDPHQPLRVDVRRALALVVEARIAIHPDYEWADVAARVRTALVERFGFATAQLARPVVPSRMLAAIEAVRGVAHTVSLKVDALDDAELALRIDPVDPPDTDFKPAVDPLQDIERPPWIEVGGASYDDIERKYAGAQIAYLSAYVPETLILELAS
jgi:hypothetical protein